MWRYRELVEVVERLKAAIAPGKANSEVIEALISLTQSRKQLEPKEGYRLFSSIIPMISQSADSPTDLHFALEVLQRVYDSEVRGRMNFGDELKWLLKSKSRLVVEIQELLTGIDFDHVRYFLNVVGDRTISYDNILRNAYLKDVADTFLDVIQQSPERLALLLEIFTRNGAVAQFQLTRTITDVDFWRIKGEIMEMLTLPMKRDFLENVRGEFPQAILIENVMARTAITKEGTVSASQSFLKIWDGIIAEVTDQGLRIITKFEVKSGMQGFEQGFDQILRTQFTRFGTPGDELRVIMPNGTERIFKFSNKPGTPNSISGLEAENILITPKGESAFLPNQSVSAAVPVGKGKTQEFDFTTLLLELNGREIDHFDIEALVMDLLMSIGR